MLIVPPPMFAISAPLAISYLGKNSSSSEISTYTFTSQSLGTEAADRYIIVAAGIDGNPQQNINSCTIGGVSATRVIHQLAVGGEQTAAIFSALVPTGTTGNIVVTLSGTAYGCGIQFWRLTGTSNGTTPTTASDGDETSSVLSASLTIPTGGCAVGFVTWQADGAVATTTWTNLTEETSSDVQYSLNGDVSMSAARSTTAGTLTRTATASETINGPDRCALVLAAWSD